MTTPKLEAMAAKAKRDGWIGALDYADPEMYRNDAFTILDGKTGREIGRFDRREDRDLCLAAPKMVQMIEALKNISAQCQKAIDLGAEGSWYFEDIEDIDDVAKAAIAAAEGGAK